MAKTEEEKLAARNRVANKATWRAMIDRCYNERHISYPHYGGNGIKVCDRWLNSFEAFHSDMGTRPSKQHSIDRIDPTGNYEPDNCRWANRIEQIYNKTKVKNAEHVGVYFNKQYQLWIAYMRANNMQVLKGYYFTKEQAIEARKHAEATWLEGYSTYNS